MWDGAEVEWTKIDGEKGMFVFMNLCAFIELRLRHIRFPPLIKGREALDLRPNALKVFEYLLRRDQNSIETQLKRFQMIDQEALAYWVRRALAQPEFTQEAVLAVIDKGQVLSRERFPVEIFKTFLGCFYDREEGVPRSGRNDPEPGL